MEPKNTKRLNGELKKWHKKPMPMVKIDHSNL